MTKTAAKIETAAKSAMDTAKATMEEATRNVEKMMGFEMPKFDASAFDMSKLEVPAAMREATEKTMAQAKEAYGKLKAAAEDATSVIESTYATASKGTTEFNLKALDNARTNINSAFDFARNLMGVKTVSEAVELQTSYLRAQFETFQTQAKDLQSFAQKVATDTAAPVKASVDKVVNLKK